MMIDKASDRYRAQLATGIVAFALGCDAKDVEQGERGTRAVSTMRQLAMYLTYTAFEMSLSRCAAAFARDRSTVAHACHAVEDRRDDKHFDCWIDGLETGLKALAPFAPDQSGALV